MATTHTYTPQFILQHAHDTAHAVSSEITQASTSHVNHQLGRVHARLDRTQAHIKQTNAAASHAWINTVVLWVVVLVHTGCIAFLVYYTVVHQHDKIEAMQAGKQKQTTA